MIAKAERHSWRGPLGCHFSGVQREADLRLEPPPHSLQMGERRCTRIEWKITVEVPECILNCRSICKPYAGTGFSQSTRCFSKCREKRDLMSNGLCKWGKKLSRRAGLTQ
jgi:hypothetical protein